MTGVAVRQGAPSAAFVGLVQAELARYVKLRQAVFANYSESATGYICSCSKKVDGLPFSDWSPSRVDGDDGRMASNQQFQSPPRGVCQRHGAVWIRRSERNAHSELPRTVKTTSAHVQQLYMLQYFTPEVLASFAGLQSGYLIGM